jgi:DUF1365 family protein
MTASAIYAGSVIHQRLRPVRHRLRYTMVEFLLDLDELPSLAGRLRLFAHNRFGLFAFHERDHGDGTRLGLRAWVERHVAAAGIDTPCGAIRLLCMPRILGHAFNPISVFFCHAQDSSLIALLYEVRNTFGEKHTYLIRADGSKPQQHQSCDKQFFVSPFMPMQLTYRFRTRPPGEHVSLGITASDADGIVIATAFGGAREALTDRALLRLFVRMPIQGLKILSAIHWEALKLWCRGLQLRQRPAAPSRTVTIAEESVLF